MGVWKFEKMGLDDIIRSIMALVVTIVLALMVLSELEVPEWFIGTSITVYGFYFGTPLMKTAIKKIRED